MLPELCGLRSDHQGIFYNFTHSVLYAQIYLITRLMKILYTFRCLPLAFSLGLFLPVPSHGQAYGKQVDRVKVAAVQVSGYDKTIMPGEVRNPVRKALEYIDRAARDSAQLVVFPEYYLGRITIPGKETRAISEAAADHQIYVIIGSWEVFDDGTFANAALLFGRDGKILGKYYKTHAAVDTYEGEPAYSKPPAGHDKDWFIQHDPEWIMKRGQEFPVFDLDFARIGILTCYDGWFPEPFRILSLKGAEILIWVNSRKGKIEDYIVLTAMHHNTVSMVCTNQAYGSGTKIAEWPRTIIAACPDTGEQYISATLDLERLRQARRISRNAQQRRPEIYGEILMEIPGK